MTSKLPLKATIEAKIKELKMACEILKLQILILIYEGKVKILQMGH